MLNEFTQHFAARGFSMPCLFVVEFLNVPTSIGMHELVTQLNFFCEGSELPGDQILYQENRVYNMPEKFAYGKLHDEMNLIFRVDGSLDVKRFLSAWVNAIYDPSTGDLHYKNDYAGTIRITQINQAGDSVYSVELEKAYPIQVQPITLGWEQSTDYSRLSTVFTFKTYKEVSPENFFAASQQAFKGASYVQKEGGGMEVLKDRNTTSRYNEIIDSGMKNIIPGNFA